MPEQKQLTTSKDPIIQLLTANKKAIESVLPKHLTPERVLRLCYQAITTTPKLRQCTQQSLLNCIIELSKRGLELGYTAHILPFKQTATFIADYKGLIELAHRSGMIQAFRFKPVYEKDKFEYEEGTNYSIQHKPCREKDRGKLIAAYAIVYFKHGGYDFEVVEQADIDVIKSQAPGAKSQDSPWNTENEWTMWCKSAVRRLAKRIPQSPDLQRVAYLDELAESGVKQSFDFEIEPTDAEFEVEQKPSQDETKQKIEEKLHSMQQGKQTTIESEEQEAVLQAILKYDADEIENAQKQLGFVVGINKLGALTLDALNVLSDELEKLKK